MSGKRKNQSNSTKTQKRPSVTAKNNNRDDDSDSDTDDSPIPMFIPIIIPQAPPPLPTKNKKESVEDRIRKSGMDEAVKEQMIAKYKNADNDKQKHMEWFENLLKIPFGKYAVLPITKSEPLKVKQAFFKQAQSNLDLAVYGMEKVKEEVIDYIAQFVSTNNNSSPRVIGLVGQPGVGKCLGKGTEILMYNGKIKKVENIVVGDVIMGDDSTPRNVLALGRGRDKMYRVTHDTGESYVVNSQHILSLKYTGDVPLIVDETKKSRFVVSYFNIDIREKIINENFCYKEKDKIKVYDKALKFIKENWKKDWIHDINIEHYLRLKHDSDRESKNYRKHLKGYCVGVDFKFKSSDNATLMYEKGYNLGVLAFEERYRGPSIKITIPEDYLTNSRDARLELLRGMSDSAGRRHPKRGVIISIPDFQPRLAKDVYFLAKSVGLYCDEPKVVGDKIEIRYYGNACRNELTFKNWTCYKEEYEGQPLTSAITITELPEDDYYGFMIDGNHRFVLGNFVVTHNTAIVRRGLSEALKRPMYCISMGGITDSSHFQGFDFTYVGSRHGVIVQALMETKVMNPIIFFDELDKISKNVDGLEVENLLVHLTDPVQNHNFHDKYFTDINIDLSKAVLIFSFNDEKSINPILLDRIHVIRVPTPDTAGKIVIAQKYLLKEVAPNVGFRFEDIILTDEVCRKLISTYCKDDKGVRNLKNMITTLCMKLNTSMYLHQKKYTKLPETITLPFTFTWEQVEQLLGDRERESILDHMFI